MNIKNKNVSKGAVSGPVLLLYVNISLRWYSESSKIDTFGLKAYNI